MLKKVLMWAVLATFLATCTTAGQRDLAGDWAGTLNIAGVNLRLIFHITETNRGPTTVLESVDQQNALIPAMTVLDGDSITFTVEGLDVEYVATIMGDTMVGEFSQLGNSMPDFTITRNRSQ